MPPLQTDVLSATQVLIEASCLYTQTGGAVHIFRMADEGETSLLKINWLKTNLPKNQLA